ncbi:MAG: hypothetical protein ACT4PE_15525, partial [Candidatus Eiseniibacteriota bacterium]
MQRWITRLIILAGVVALGAPVSADTVGRLPVQEGGRVKPFDTYARELLMEVTGKESWEGWAATDVALSMMEDGSAWRQKPMVRVDHLELKDRFALERGRKHFSFD